MQKNKFLFVFIFILLTYNLYSQSDSKRFLVLRAEFAEDNLATTTGNGLFDFGTESEYNIDRPPHNRTYFQHQMLGLKNYFQRVSNNRFSIEADVLPAGENDVYKLSENMVYYSGQEDDDLKNQRWSELLRDVLMLAKEQDNPDFSLYDGVIIFHAGIGSDFAFDFDATPYDIQSVYLDFETLQTTLGESSSSFQGIDVGNGIFIRDGIILPEAQSQEGYELGLLGTMTLLMGSKLGMPSMFNTITGRAGIGRWGLMDQGSYNMQGLVPAYPCAWMKVYMGWEEPIVVTHGKDLKIGTTNTITAPHLYKIPITDKEYFLIENRQTDPTNDGVTFGRDEYGNRAQFDTLGNVTADSDLKVITSIDEYDFGLPGSGLLIWHIDENVIKDSLATNSINNNIDHRGVDLIECDGAQDLGYYYGMFDAAYGAESGDYYDPYWAGNESHKYVNNQTDTVALSPYTIPNSNTYDNSKSHINIYNISSNDTVMTFSVKNDRLVDGFPKYVDAEFFNGSLKTIHYKNTKYIIALSTTGELYCWDMEGNSFTDKNLILEIDNSFSLPLAVNDFNSDGNSEIILVGESGKLYVISIDNNIASITKQEDLSGVPTAGPTIFPSTEFANNSPQRIFVGNMNGELISIEFSNEIMDVNRFKVVSDAITGLASYSITDVAVISNNGEYALLSQSLDVKDSYEIDSDTDNPFLTLADFNGIEGIEPMFSSTVPALGDLDNDGLPELFRQYQTDLRGYNYEGSPVNNYPVQLSDTDATFEKTSPLILDTDQYGTIIINATLNGQITAHDSNGKMVSGFPLTIGKAAHTSPVIANLDNDAFLECAVISGDGYLYIYNLDITLKSDGRGWLCYGADQFNSFSLPGTSVSTATASEILPEKGSYCYPNPAYDGYSNIRYRLTQSVNSVIIRIYDIAGDMVEELTGTGLTPGDHEIRWDVTSVHSGAYLARIEASSNSESVVQFIKIAVVK